MTNEADSKYLDVFPTWLRTLGSDAERIVEAIGDTALPDAARRALTGGLNYLFKSLDLIPDGIDDIGYLDDAFVLRVAAEHASREDLDKVPLEKSRVVAELTNDVDAIKSFLGADYERLETYVSGLRRGAARGRSVDDIVNNSSVHAEFKADVHAFAKNYAAPSFNREGKNLVKLRAFFDAKLPR